VNYLENDAHASPSGNRLLLTLAAILLAIPVVALLWIGSYASVEPTLAGFPFFIWYQFLWVFLCAAGTWAAYRVVRIARPDRKEARR
jgi:membrane protein implicated in regulation of membrane protease activity